MTMRVICGFEAQVFEEAGDSGARSTSGTTIITANQRSGDAALQISLTGGANVFPFEWTGISAADTETYVGFGLRITAFSATDTETSTVLLIQDGAATNIATLIILRSGTDIVLRLLNVTQATVDTSTTTLETDTWYFLELRIENSDTGNYELRIDGVTEFSGTEDFRNTDTTVQQAQLTNVPSNSDACTLQFDDVYIDSAAFLGFHEVLLLRPDGDGTDTAWTGDSTAVDDVPPHDSGSTVINTSNNPDTETPTMQDSADVGLSGTVNAVQVETFGERDSNPTAVCHVRMRADSAVTTRVNDGADDAFATNAFTIGMWLCRDDTPNSNPWTLALLDGIEGGPSHQQAQSRNINVTAVHTMVSITRRSPPPWLRRRRNPIYNR